MPWKIQFFNDKKDDKTMKPKQYANMMVLNL